MTCTTTCTHAPPLIVLCLLACYVGTCSKPRKKRPVPDSLATPEELAAMAPSGSFPLHSTTQGGINALDVNPDAQAVVATAGMDGSVRVYDYVQVGRMDARVTRMHV